MRTLRKPESKRTANNAFIARVDIAPGHEEIMADRIIGRGRFSSCPVVAGFSRSACIILLLRFSFGNPDRGIWTRAKSFPDDVGCTNFPFVVADRDVLSDLMNADGSSIVELTAPSANVCENDPSFTPDGSRIVFDRFDPDANEEAFWSMDLSGGDRQRIGPCCFDPNVSPNGKRLSFLTNNGQPGGTALFTSSIDGSNLFQVTPFSFDVAVKQDWAPDGRRLVFTQNGDVLMAGVSANIATIRPDGTDLRFVTHYQGGAASAFVGSYSPDGRWIVFRLNENGLFGLFKIHPDGTHLKTILPLSSFRPRFIDWGARPSEDDNNEEGW